MTSDSLRLFFALPCPAELAARIAAWRDRLQLGGHAVAPGNLHLTLAFLGQQPGDCLPGLRQLGAELHPHAFELHLDRLVRRRNGLLYLAPSQVPEALLELAQELRTALLAAGFALEDRAFLAHLTLLRRSTVPPADAAPSFAWPVRHFSLFASEQTGRGTCYRQLARWPLRRGD